MLFRSLRKGPDPFRQGGGGCGRGDGGGTREPEQASPAEGHQPSALPQLRLCLQKLSIASIDEMADHGMLRRIRLHKNLSRLFPPACAARQLKELGVRAIVLEARDRVGGRAYTDTQTLGRKFDQGPYWLHNKATNPLVPLARQLGTNLLESSYSNMRVFDQGALYRNISFGDVEAALEAWTLRQTLAFVKKDRSLGASLPNPTPAQKFVKNIFAVEMGEDPDLVSLQSYAALEAGEDLIPEAGMGTLAQGLSSGLDIRLDCPVSAVVWDGRHGVTVRGSFGQLTARKLIITVPTAVLASGAIRFEPALPQTTQAAISNLPMGAFEKHAMVLSQAMPDLPEYAMSNSLVQKGVYHVLMVSPDKKMVTAFLPGTISRDLYREGAPAIEAFTDSLLKDVIGSQMRVVARASSNWHGDPYALGSYSIAKVGHADARKIYAQPIEDRLFFTGEAIDDPLALTAGAAWQIGRAHV